MRFACDQCNAQYSIADEKLAGRRVKIRCKKCGNVIVLSADGVVPKLDLSSDLEEGSGQEGWSGDLNSGSLQALQPEMAGNGQTEAVAAMTNNKGPDQDPNAAPEGKNPLAGLAVVGGQPTAPRSDPELERELGSAFQAMFDEHQSQAAPASTGLASPPEGSEEPEWYVAIGDEQTGPLTYGQLVDHWTVGDIRSDSLCWRNGMVDWVPIADVPDLTSLREMNVRPPSTHEPAEMSGDLKQPPKIAPPPEAAAPADAWKPSAGSALASLAAAELEPTGTSPAAKPVVAGVSASSSQKSALERLIASDSAQPSGSAFGASEKSASTVRPLPKRSEAVSNLPLREVHTPPHAEKKSWLMPTLLVMMFFLVLGIGGAVLYMLMNRQPAPIAMATPPQTGPSAEELARKAAEAALAKQAADEAAAKKAAEEAAAKKAAEEAEAKKEAKKEAAEARAAKKNSSKAKRSTRRSRPSRKAEPEPVEEKAPEPPPKKSSRLTDDDLLPGGGGSALPSRLDESDILRTLRQNRSAVRICLERQRSADPGLAGQMKVKLMIQPSGKVSSVTVQPSKFSDAEVGRCMKSKARRWRFPRFSGSPVPVDFPVRVTGG